jgi:DNA-directed RNA polymerase subunit E'/Rpb7
MKKFTFLSYLCILVFMAIAVPSLAGTVKANCRPVDNIDATSNRYQFKISNPSKIEIPTGANIRVRIAAKPIKNVKTQTINRTFNFVLTEPLVAGSEANFPGSNFAKSCTAQAKW